MICHRCDPSDDYTRSGLEVHAEETGHPLCVICQRSLPAGDLQVCIGCRERTRGNLNDIADAWTELPEALRQHTGDRREQPGGDILPLLAGGSEGSTGRIGVRLRDGRLDATHGLDEHPTDPPSIAHALASWEDDWRAVRGEAAAIGTGRPDDVFRAAVDYLLAGMNWAAMTHPAFDEFATDVQQLRMHLLRAVGWLDASTSGAPCLMCSTPGKRVDLERGWEDPTVCVHERPDLRLRLRRTDWLWETTRQRDTRVVAWEQAHARCEQGGRGDIWFCPRHGGAYTQGEYHEIIRGRLERIAREGQAGSLSA